MEGIGSEVSQKIRAAIKAKLVELGAYVDDELPDYIMVMVANKRTRAQMDEDLHLFLSSNTKIFTSWLHTVLQKLQEVTVAGMDNKKDPESKKSSKRKKGDSEDVKSGKSSEEGLDKVKKHAKKHKEGKKSKKNKNKSKEKTKSKRSDKDEKEKSGKDGEKKAGDEDEKKEKSKKVQLNEVVGKAILGDLKKNKKLKDDARQESSSQSSSSSEDGSHSEGKMTKKNGKGEENKKKEAQGADAVVSITNETPTGKESNNNQKNKKEVVEDEFNIEPLKPNEKEDEMESHKSEEAKKRVEPSPQVEKTISAPTEELLKQHDKIQNEQMKGEGTEGKKPTSDSEESLSPEEIRKQLLLSRAKRKLEESKKAARMRSNSPEVLIIGESIGSGGRQKDLQTASRRQPDVRSNRSTHSGDKESSRPGSPRRSRHSTMPSERSQSSERSPRRSARKSRPVESSNKERRAVTSRSGRNSFQAERESGKGNGEGVRRRNIIRISETIEMEKNMGAKRGSETEKEKVRKRPVSSRVVTIAAPEAPEIPSIVKVKPRNFIPKEKQANKALILKAVADAEKSIATVPTRPEIVTEPKKEGLYTKKLREKRYEKLAVTLSNIRRSPDYKDRRISADSDKSDKSRVKRDSSDVSDSGKVKSDLLSKKMSRSDDHFISSKATGTEKNDKYIRCWLEGVERAVKDDEMLNPSEMDDFVHSNPTDEERGKPEKGEKQRKRKAANASEHSSTKALKLGGKGIPNARTVPDKVSQKGPKIVVTLDGVDTKAIKDLILKNKESTGKPLVSTSKKVGKELGVSREKPPMDVSRKSGFEKISDRFKRLKKARTEEEVTGTKKGSKSSKREISEKKAASESKNRQLIAQLSEKFGKIDREFENRKRKRPDEDRRYPYDSRRNEKEDDDRIEDRIEDRIGDRIDDRIDDRIGRYRNSDRRSFREGGFGFYRSS